MRSKIYCDVSKYYLPDMAGCQVDVDVKLFDLERENVTVFAGSSLLASYLCGYQQSSSPPPHYSAASARW